MNKLAPALGILFIVFIGIIVVSEPFYIIEEGTQAIVLRFGKIQNVDQEAGFKFKVPFLDQAIIYPKKIMSWDGEPQKFPTQENKFIWVDTTARWQISNLLKFYESVGRVNNAYGRLDDIIDSTVRTVIANNTLDEAVRNTNIINSIDRTNLDPSLKASISDSYVPVKKGRSGMSSIMLNSIKAQIEEQFGINLIDIVIRQISYTEELTVSVQQRMIAERRQVAEKIRSEGEGEKQKILGSLSKEKQTILSQAYAEAERIKGEGDAEAQQISAQAYNENPTFYAFWRALESYKRTFPQFKKTLTTDMDYFKYLYNQKGN